MMMDFTVERMAETLGLSCKFLYLLSNRTPDFYRIYKIPKKNGKFRTIEAPVPILKRIQRYIVNEILVDHASEAVTAFEPGCSVKCNASFHCGKPIIVSLDIRNFFTSLKYALVLSLFSQNVDEKQSAVMLAKLCTLYGHLPQGSAASPRISNLILRDFDAEILKYCQEHGLKYTRYADDLTFSGNPDNEEITELIRLCRRELGKIGLHLNNDKIHIQRKGMRQKVTGVVVNEKLNAPREVRRLIRQKMYYLNKHWEHEWRNLDEHSLKVLLGKVNFIWDLNRKNPEIGEYRRQLLEIQRFFHA